MRKPFAIWKQVLIVVVLFFGSLMALPNIFGKNPAVQMEFANAEAATAMLKETNWEKLQLVPPSSFQQQDGKLDLIFENTDYQIQAKDYLAKRYPEANVSVNLLSNAPKWLEHLGFSPMNLGLDLRGGISFLLQVDSQELFSRKSNELSDTISSTLAKENIPVKAINIKANGGVLAVFNNDSERDSALNALYRVLPAEVERVNVDGNSVHFRYSELEISRLKYRAAEQNRMRMSERVNSLGVAEPSIQVVGDDRILIQLPGIQDVNQAKQLIGSTATLEFYLVDENADIAQAVKLGRAKVNQKLAFFADKSPIVLKRKMILSGEHIVDAAANPRGQEGPQVDVTLDSAGGAKMAQITRENRDKSMAIIYVEYVPVTRIDANGEEKTTVEKHETVINAAVIRGQFSSRFQISGVTPIERAERLATSLRAGSLVAPVYIIEERTIGPSAGKQNISQGFNASILGLALVVAFMSFYYRRYGTYANIALVMNLVLLVALMSWIGATLTLPGIAGIVLTLGMAVDSNVLIYERIREEKEFGLSTYEAVELGFKNALSTIVDANITTLIVALMLFSFGAGPIKGFAVTLSLGILTTMFSAIMITRSLIEYFELRKDNPQIDF